MGIHQITAFHCELFTNNPAMALAKFILLNIIVRMKKRYDIYL